MHEILNTRVWALESFFFERAKSAILKGLEKGDLSNLEIYNPAKARESRDHYAGLSWNENIGAYVHTVQGKNIAHIPVVGSMTKRGGWCTYGSKEYINRINKANQAQDVDAIVLEIDGPGGSVDGTEEFGMAVKNSSKPLVAYVDGMAASAHYWVTSQAQHIVANSEITSWIGSIGTLVVHVNEQGWYTQKGVTVEIIRAPQSVDKARENPYEPLSEEARARLLEELSLITDHFITTVKSGRGARLKTGDEDIFTGKVYNGKEALQMGMIDEIGNLQAALDKAAELASKSKSIHNNNRNSMKLKDWFSGAKSEASADDKEISIKESELSELRSDMEAAIREREQAQTDLSAAQAELVTVKAERDALAAKIAVLEKQPDAAAAAAAKDGDENGGAEGAQREKQSWELKAEKKRKSLKS
jgi:signal peptide peptidase SppA